MARTSVDDVERVYVLRFRQLFRLAHAITGDRETAEDVVHEAFVHAIDRLDTYRASGPLDAWIWRTVLNGARDVYRARKRRSHVGDDVLDRVASPPAFDDAQIAVRSAARALPERQRLVLFLYHFGELDYATIGELLGIAPGTVAATLNAARAKLRKALEEKSASTGSDRYGVG